MRNRLLSITRNGIPYVRELRLLPHIKSASACILMQQLEYWFEKYPDGFYKFLDSCPSHEKYINFDSWKEELAFSLQEFRTAFDSIGVRYSSKSAYNAAADKFTSNELEPKNQKYYCSYNDKRSGLTYYFRNHSAVDSALDKLVNTKGKAEKKAAKTESTVNAETLSTEMPKVDLPTSRKSMSSINNETENTNSENTNPENTQERSQGSRVCENPNQESNIPHTNRTRDISRQHQDMSEVQDVKYTSLDEVLDPNINPPSAAPLNNSQQEENNEVVGGELVAITVAEELPHSDLPEKLAQTMTNYDNGIIRKLDDATVKQVALIRLGDFPKRYRKSGKILSSSPNDINPAFLEHFFISHKFDNLDYARSTIASWERDPAKWDSLRQAVGIWEAVRDSGNTNIVRDVFKAKKRQQAQSSNSGNAAVNLAANLFNIAN